MLNMSRSIKMDNYDLLPLPELRFEKSFRSRVYLSDFSVVSQEYPTPAFHGF